MNESLNIANAVRIPIRDIDGTDIRLADFIGRRNLVVVLLRGLW
jgi:hypothetical protein